MLGVLGLAIGLPNIAVNLFGGVLADRLSKRMMLGLSALGSGIAVAILAVLDFGDQLQVWHVIAVAIVMSVISGLDWPARVAMYPYLVRPKAYLSAIALNSFIWQATRLAVPGFAGLCILYFGTDATLVLAALCFGVMAWTMFRMKVETAAESTGQTAMTDLVEGLKFVITEPLYRFMLLLTFMGMFLVNSHVQIMPALAVALGGEAGLFGMLMMMGGLGSVVGTLLLGSSRHSEHVGPILIGSGVLTALTTALFAIAVAMQVIWLALAFEFACAFFAAIFTVGSLTIMQLNVPNHLRGRVMGIHTIGYSLIPLGGIYLGLLETWIPVVGAMVLGCVVYAVSIVVVFGTRRELRRLSFASSTPLAG